MRTLPPVGGVEGADERDDGGFAGAGGADESGDGAGFGLEADAVEDGLAGLVGEGDVVEGDVAVDGGMMTVRVGSLSSSRFVENLGGAVEAGEGFGELGADGDELDDGGDHEGEQHGVLDVAADVEAVGGDLVARRGT